ncbi:MAG: hypothetical protein IJW48_01980 [Clostridia bacterium]|nr:hypothetical protein [Clostridia bacterium]
MLSQKILDTDVKSLKVSSLPTRPTSSSSYGGKGYTSRDMKEAFDRLSIYIIEHYNSLLDDIAAEPEASIAAAMKTGISDSHTLASLFGDIVSGAFANYMTVFGESLAVYLGEMREELDEIKSRLG